MNYISYQIKGIEGQFKIPIHPEDDVEYISSRIKNDFSIIPNLTAQHNGSELQNTDTLDQIQGVITFESKEAQSHLQYYRRPIISQRCQDKTFFTVFTTINFQSMIKGNKIEVDIENDTLSSLQSKVKNMLLQNYKEQINNNKLNTMKILLFLPGGIPFLDNFSLKNFVSQFPSLFPNFYAIILYDNTITDSILDRTYDTICNIKDENLKTLISPDYANDTFSLCEIASVLGYIQNNGENSKRMIYSIAKFCPFSPLICGLFHLLNLRLTGRTIVQITAPLLTLFTFMGQKINVQTNLFSSTVKFLTYFMNTKISKRVPCTIYNRFNCVGYLDEFFKENEIAKKVGGIVAFDPDLTEQDWITFEFPSLCEEDYKNAENCTKSLQIVPLLSLRELHSVSLFQGLNGPWLYLSTSISEEEAEQNVIDYINPEEGLVKQGTYETVAIECIGFDYNKNPRLFDEKVIDLIDPEKVTQLVFILIDKSGSMCMNFGDGMNRFQASQELFINFADNCDKTHTTSLFGSVMFNHMTEVRNQLNPLLTNFKRRMMIQGERPSGGTRMATAMKHAADLLLQANKGNKYPNAVLRLIVISDGSDGCSGNEIASVCNYILTNKIRVDGVVVSNEISSELVAISRFSGGVVFFARNLSEGIDYFSKEEFYNVNLRRFGIIKLPNVTSNELRSLPHFLPNDLDCFVPAKLSDYSSQHKKVTSPLYAIHHYENDSENRSKVNKRIIDELKKIISNPNDDFRVFPLKDRIDVWRVLIKGADESPYQDHWFYLIVEFTNEYPQNYPTFRFVRPPFHPNINDQGRVIIESLDRRYRSDISVIELIAEIQLLLLEPDFKNCVDRKREEMRSNKQKFLQMIDEWNASNGKKCPADWESEWIIMPDDESIKNTKIEKCPIVPKQFLCPLTREIMRMPVKATSGVFYEKNALMKYVSSSPVCRQKTDQNFDQNLNLEVDEDMRKKIMNWMKENKYNDDVIDDDDDNIIYFRSTDRIINDVIYIKNDEK